MRRILVATFWQALSKRRQTMIARMFKAASGITLAGALALGMASSSMAAPVSNAAALKSAVPEQTDQVRWRGGGFGAGLGVGLLGGAALGYGYGPGYGYYPAYGYPAYGYYGGPYYYGHRRYYGGRGYGRRYGGGYRGRYAGRRWR
jgi:hypothetical protein